MGKDDLYTLLGAGCERVDTLARVPPRVVQERRAERAVLWPPHPAHERLVTLCSNTHKHTFPITLIKSQNTFGFRAKGVKSTENTFRRRAVKHLTHGTTI